MQLSPDPHVKGCTMENVPTRLMGGGTGWEGCGEEEKGCGEEKKGVRRRGKGVRRREKQGCGEEKTGCGEEKKVYFGATVDPFYFECNHRAPLLPTNMYITSTISLKRVIECCRKYTIKPV